MGVRLAQFSTPFRWTVRLIVWGVGLAIMVPAYRLGSTFGMIPVVQECARAQSGKTNGLFEAQEFCLCMFLKSNYLESRRQEPLLRDVMALREPSCDRVGIWKSARERSVYRVTLYDNNRFHAEPMSDFAPTAFSGEASGFWGETRGKLVWIYDEGVTWPPDINRIVEESTDRFTVIEVNGERTEFTRERKAETGRCAAA